MISPPAWCVASGQATAEKLVAAFGTDTLDVLDDEPEKLKPIKGITNKRGADP